MIVKAFCMPGGHAVDVLLDEPMRVPEGWSLVPAEVIPAPKGPDDPWSPGIWFYKEGSDTKILCCPHHSIINPKEEGTA